jgi:hypothetical protein
VGHISLLENGGTVVVVGGWNKAWQSFRDNPRIIFWSGEQKEVARFVRNREFPANCKAVIISRFLSHTELGVVLPEARRRRITLFANKNDGEITELLDDLTRDLRERELPAPEPKPLPTDTPIEETTVAKRQTAKKGELNQVIQFVDWQKTNIDNARALMATAIKDLGIRTTLNSLAQFIRVQRKKAGIDNATNVGTPGAKKVKKDLSPRKVHPLGPELDVAVSTLDEAIKNLADVREYLLKVTAENEELRAQNAKLKPLLDVIKALK